MSADGPAITEARNEAVATLTLNRPGLRNALTDEVLAELAERLGALEQDTAVHCVVIAGSDKVFASGADIRALAGKRPLDLYYGRRAELWAQLRRVRVPLVAAVSGFCLGGGCELAMGCDVIVASETARFGLPETQLGLIPGAGGTQLLVRAIGKAKAMDVILAGRLLSAAEAEAAGLVSRLASAENWQVEAEAVAAQIAARAPLAVRLAKEAVSGAMSVGLEAGIDLERRAFAIAMSSEDADEGLTAFLEKRDPTWLGR